MFTWPVKWVLKKLLVKLIPALVSLGLLSLAGVDVTTYVEELLASLGLTEEETTTGKGE